MLSIVFSMICRPRSREMGAVFIDGKREAVPQFISPHSLSRSLGLPGMSLLNLRRGAPARGLSGDPRRPAFHGFPLVSQALDDLIRLPLGAARLTLPPIGK